MVFDLNFVTLPWANGTQDPSTTWGIIFTKFSRLSIGRSIKDLITLITFVYFSSLPFLATFMVGTSLCCCSWIWWSTSASGATSLWRFDDIISKSQNHDVSWNSPDCATSSHHMPTLPAKLSWTKHLPWQSCIDLTHCSYARPAAWFWLRNPKGFVPDSKQGWPKKSYHPQFPKEFALQRLRRKREVERDWHWYGITFQRSDNDWELVTICWSTSMPSWTSPPTPQSKEPWAMWKWTLLCFHPFAKWCMWRVWPT